MRFSLKWLLAAVTYAAVACASVICASDHWKNALAFAAFSLASMALVGGAFSRRGTRAFLLGFAVSSVLFSFGASGDFHATTDVVAAVDDWTSRVGKYLVKTRQAAAVDYVVSKYNLKGDFSHGVIVRRESHDGETYVSFGDGRYFGSEHYKDRFPVPRSAYVSAVDGETVQAILMSHLIFLFSLAGGLLGQWFHRREEMAARDVRP